MTTTIEPASSPPTLVDRLKDRRELDEKLPPPAERKEIREKAGATVSEVAAEIGVTYQTVWQWENRPPKRIRREHAIAYLALLRQFAVLAACDDQATFTQK